jgi:hypothetical protein
MLQHKDTHKISELKNGFTHAWLEPDFIFRSLKCFSFSRLNKGLAFFKLKGYSFEWVMSILIVMPFMGIKTVNSLSGLVEAKKDVFYRLKNNVNICWRYILWLFAMKFIRLTAQTSDSSLIRCLIFDDSLLPKSGKFIEKVSKVWDHVQKRSVLGFKLLLMGYWDGVSFIPLDFSLHREKGKNKQNPFGLRSKDFRNQHKKKRIKGSHSYDRAMEADDSKIEAMLRMLKRAVSHKINFDYVLTDSWFTCEALIEAVWNIKRKQVHLIGMYCKVRTLFGFNGKELTYSQIRNCLGKPKRCRKVKLQYLQTKVLYKGRELQLFFSRQGKNGKWKVLLTTNTSISFLQLIEIYQTRWAIEVFFKEAKQLLNMGKCQSNDFDAQITDLTITMIQHTMLTYRYRYDTYESKGALFDQLQENINQHRLNERLWGLFLEIINILATLFDGVDEMDLLTKIINDDTAMEMMNRLFLIDPHPCEAA